MSSEKIEDEKDKFPIPKWAVTPTTGAHLDVYKGSQLIQKLMIDEKHAYYFGRNNKQVDFAVEHASCSRVHALLLYHGVLKRFALVDMESSHGTFIGNVRISPLTVVFIDIGSQFQLGASTRKYAVRLKPEDGSAEGPEDESGLPCITDERLDHLTEYNTAQNRRIPQLPISVEEARRKKRPRGNVVFLDAEDIINPEDVDPSVGRFRNLVTSAIISNNPLGKRRGDERISNKNEPQRKVIRPSREVLTQPLSSTFGLAPLNAAPDLDLYGKSLPQPGDHQVLTVDFDDSKAYHKKKYAKEAWPGRKPTGVF
ncbi:unnamed protein product [Caenorhabditis auriculariae]|uniref:FHA domain-containing protein n=1 Tax=Caenorhabditis auriculariae TaxID=2777116 RepID=A0A8S1GRT6_9PELO|nr:unnamed protein product [Caenorhabditis auriculariae]